jgi:hypothetical protein
MMIDGPKLTIGDREFVIAPANLGAMRRQLLGYQKHEAGTAERLDVSMQFILDVLHRNHPDVDMAFLDEWVDARNMSSILTTIQSAAGYKASGDADAGEPKAGA